MSSQSAINILESGDVRAFRAGFARVFAHLPQPRSQREAEITFHSARTQAESVSFARRAYSHAWLVERNLPSHLPDHMRPKAERLYPRIVEAVGISCGTKNPLMKPIVQAVQRAMETRVQELYAEGATDANLVRSEIRTAGAREMQRIVGAASLPPA